MIRLSILLGLSFYGVNLAGMMSLPKGHVIKAIGVPNKFGLVMRPICATNKNPFYYQKLAQDKLEELKNEEKKYSNLTKASVSIALAGAGFEDYGLGFVSFFLFGFGHMFHKTNCNRIRAERDEALDHLYGRTKK
jgi:hypothetical protein